MTQLYDKHLRPIGMRATQFTLLQALNRSGPISQGAIGDLLSLDSTTLTRTLALLEANGWIRWLPGDDRRERHWELTAKGRQAYERALPLWEAAQTRLQGKLGRTAWAALLVAATHAAEAARNA